MTWIPNLIFHLSLLKKGAICTRVILTHARLSHITTLTVADFGFARDADNRDVSGKIGTIAYMVHIACVLGCMCLCGYMRMYGCSTTVILDESHPSCPTWTIPKVPPPFRACVCAAPGGPEDPSASPFFCSRSKKR